MGPVMQINLSGKTALISGATAGIGFAIAQSLAESGATVYINGRSEARVAEAIQKLTKNVPSAKFHGITADLGTAAGAQIVYKALPEVDILINNLGIYEIKDFFEVTDSEWQNIFDVNVMSAVRLSRYYTPLMVKKKWGRVIFISSESGIQIPAEMIHYGVTKTALLALSRGLAQAVAATGVTVNAVLPGPTKTEGVMAYIDKMTADSDKDFESIEAEFLNSLRPTTLIKRFASTEEVANMVTYIASKEASATTGAALRVDGGVVNCIL